MQNNTIRVQHVPGLRSFPFDFAAQLHTQYVMCGTAIASSMWCAVLSLLMRAMSGTERLAYGML
eukprot:2298708-Rhodomonas_salina.2